MIVFDQYSRLKAVAELLLQLGGNAQKSICDVGSGEACLLGEFLPQWPITYIDPLLAGSTDSAQLGVDIFSADLDNKQFDIVVSIDTLEHVPSEKREAFLERLCSLAKETVVIACPCADRGEAKAVDEYVDRAFQSLYGRVNPWLAEHFQYGLPEAASVESFFTEEKAWHLQTFSNAYVPWLKELLSIVLCAWENSISREHIRRISEQFNEKLYRYDCSEPAYRSIFVASKEQLPALNLSNEAPGKEAEEIFQNIRQQLILQLIADIREAERGTSGDAAQLQHEVGIRDAEVERLKESYAEQIALRDEALRMATEKFKKEIEVRDTEVFRLNALLNEMTEWGKSSSKLVEERDIEIARLRGGMRAKG